ncbi:FAD-dependent oxidoreductase [Catellatospora sp. KI3]|uniref:NAD(P)/FAD-dependent oxidoreductase n=1 Tax=Catellatospora sp. KI3 TaxID=3041620 RepID=UPI002482A149|nr:FAD-dependent oxidoreductase [Catellatospora sp. KI3]MDI1460787.1 FAD-dependent oxidoreductase [Catellatospora sp. KI3]
MDRHRPAARRAGSRHDGRVLHPPARRPRTDGDEVLTGDRALIIGAGVFGLSLAAELAGRGWTVRVVERDRTGTRSPSYADTRILRCAHGTDTWYAASADEARAHWRQLEAETRSRLFQPVGVVSFGTEAWLADTVRTLRELDVAARPLDGAELRTRYPALAGLGGPALAEPDAGVLLAARAMAALRARAAARGVRFLRGTAAPAGAAVRWRGRELSADRIVWAVGRALPELFPGRTDVTPVAHDVFRVPAAGPFTAPGQPAWLDHVRGFYGVPGTDGRSVKVVPDLDAADQSPDQVTEYLHRHLPVLGGRRVRREPCGYADRPGGDFLLDRHPDHPHVWFLGGDSGHGFKHGPSLARHAADALAGATPPPPRFALSGRSDP